MSRRIWEICGWIGGLIVGGVIAWELYLSPYLDRANSAQKIGQIEARVDSVESEWRETHTEVQNLLSQINTRLAEIEARQR